MNLRSAFAHLQTNGVSLLNPIAIRHTGLRAFSVIAHFLWNDVSIDIRPIDDVNKFKSKLGPFFFSEKFRNIVVNLFNLNVTFTFSALFTIHILFY